MSSHREAPEISKDPVVDSTDVYAFVSPDKPDLVTLIANYIPFQDPAGGPNFFEFARRRRSTGSTSTTATAPAADIVFEFRFTTKVTNPNTFLYNTGPVKSLTDANLNRRQTYTLTKRTRKNQSQVAREERTRRAVQRRAEVDARLRRHWPRRRSSACPRTRACSSASALDAFFVDVGSIFDLGVLRPFQNLHLIPTASGRGREQPARLQRPHAGHRGADRFAHRQPEQADRRELAERRDRRVDLGLPLQGRRSAAPPDRSLSSSQTGPFTQVSRLGNPLINEAIIPMSRKDEWNKTTPLRMTNFAKYGLQPELAKLLNVLYPGVFPNLAAYTKDRADLAAILFTGIPSGVVPGFQNFTGPTIADMLRLNVAIPPAATPNAARRRRRRPGRVPQRAARHRRRRHRRAARHRRRDDPARRPVVHARRRGQHDHRRIERPARRRR